MTFPGSGSMMSLKMDDERLIAGIDVEGSVAKAAEDSGCDPSYLADFGEAAVHAARIRGRLEAGTLERISRSGAEAAGAGIRLASLVDLYLTAAWRMAEGVRDAGTSDAVAVGEVSVALARAADDAVAAACEGYERAQRTAIRRQEARRRELVDGLLTGGGDPEHLTEVAAALGFNPSAEHQVIVARTDRELVDAGPVQGKLERDVFARMGERDVLVATKDGDLVAVFPGGSADPAPGLLGMLEEAEPRRWQVAAGPSASGPGGVARSYRKAVETLEVIDRLGVPGSMFRSSEWAAHLLLVRDRAALSEVAGPVIEALGRARGGAEPLIETLEAYFAEGGNVTSIARRLHLSPRAVSYRVATIERLTGMSPRSGRDRLELRAAVIGYRFRADSLPHPGSDAADESSEQPQ